MKLRKIKARPTYVIEQGTVDRQRPTGSINWQFFHQHQDKAQAVQQVNRLVRGGPGHWRVVEHRLLFTSESDAVVQ